MPSLDRIPILPAKSAYDPAHVNILYHILQGHFDNHKGIGIPIRLTSFDGRLSTGAIDTTSYALDVRNRESTQSRAFAARDSANKVVFAVEGGLAYAVKDTSVGTVRSQVMVYGTPAGGVLGGTYPNPDFALATEYYRVYPYMIVAWYGNPSAPPVGWALCNGQTVTMRDGSTVVTPNMTDRLPIGAGGSVGIGSTAGNAWATCASLSIAHTHTIPNHQHSIGHTHSHAHTLDAHVHSIGHTHSHSHNFSHSHNHTHTIGQHTHGSAAMSITGNTGAPTTAGGSVQSGAGSTADVTGHLHAKGTLAISGSTDIGGVTGTGADATGPNTATTSTDATGQSVANTGTPGPDSSSTDATGANPTVSSTDGGGGSTTSQSPTNFNVQPPVLGWYWIMKL